MSWSPPPPSGFVGLEPTEIRDRLLRNGWGPLPIRRHNGNSQAAGKAPGINGWQLFTGFEAAKPTPADLADWGRRQRDWPGTGIACGEVVGVDLDFATDPHLAERVRGIAFTVFGETPLERQGSYPKVLLVYRAAEEIPSLHLKTADGSGDGLDMLSTGTQFVAFGIHPKTLDPYAWIGAESPLSAEPAAAPEITQAQIDTFVARVREIVELNGTGGRAGQRAGRGGSAQIARDADGKVVDGREFHLTRTVYAIALSIKADGEEITIDELAARAWERFVATTVLDDGRWNERAAWEKAKALLDRVRRGFVDLNPTPEDIGETVDPTYPDKRSTVMQAEADTAAIVSRFFGEHVPAWRNELGAWEVDAEQATDRGQSKPAEPIPVAWGARIETAIGKTALAIKGASEAARAGYNIVYAAPMHALLTELAMRFEAEGVIARVYRGYTSDDPDAPGVKMCLDLEAMQDAREAGASIQSSVCEKRTENGKLFCPFHDRCGMQRQRQAKASVWLVPHALLFQAKPAFIPTPEALVIDEGITMGALPDRPARMTLDEIREADFEIRTIADPFSSMTNDLEVARGCLVRALQAHKEDGPLQRSILLANAVKEDTAGVAYKAEWQRMLDPAITPGMDPKARKRCVEATGRHNTEVKQLAGIWDEVRTFLKSGADASGRLYVRFDAETKTRVIERRSLDTVAKTWAAPALLLDATLPAAALIEPVIGQTVDIRGDVTAKWSPYVKVRQISGAPITARKLGIIENDDERAEDTGAGTPKRAVTDLLRLIHLRASLVWPRVVVVIGPMKLIRVLHDLGLPGNVETAHFGAVAGIDRWARASGLICIGRLQPGPGITEPLAGIITGIVPAQIPPNPTGGGRWYPKAEGAIRLADGRGVRVTHNQHPDPTVEALRWQITEAGLIQSIGRLRGLRRGPEAPAFLDIINDLPLPISVDATDTWADAAPGAWAEMAPEGVILGCVADIAACFPEVAPTEKAARYRSDLTSALTSLYELNIDVRASLKRFEYKRRGRHAPARGILLPSFVGDVKTWLAERVGAIEWLRFDDPGPGSKSETPPSADRPTADIRPFPQERTAGHRQSNTAQAGVAVA